MLDALPEMFGTSNIRALQQLARIARSAYFVGADGTEQYLTTSNLRNFAMPTLFVYGVFNPSFLPSGTVTTRTSLAVANCSQLYESAEISATGHIDRIFGKNVARDVYAYVLRHLLATA